MRLKVLLPTRVLLDEEVKKATGKSKRGESKYSKIDRLKDRISINSLLIKGVNSHLLDYDPS